MKSEDFLGLTKKGAQDLSEQKNFIFRLIRINEINYFSYPSDSRPDRVCVEIEKGKVVIAKFM